MCPTDAPLTCAEALVALAVQGKVSDGMSRCILQAVYDSGTGHRALGRPLPHAAPRSLALKPNPRSGMYLYPLGFLQEELIGEYLEMQVECCGERVLLRGYYTDQGYPHTVGEDEMHSEHAWLSVRPEYYQDGERPVLIRALAGMILLNVPDPLSARLMDSYPGSVLLDAVRNTYTKQGHLDSPVRYLQWLLRNTREPDVLKAG